jgi:hypothetical protein
VAALAVNLLKTKSSQRDLHLLAREQRKLHSDSATISRLSSAINSFGEGSR